MGEALLIRRMKAAGDANNLQVDEADDLFAPEYTQASHGFTVGKIVRKSAASTHAAADGSDVAAAFVGLGVVVHVEDSNNFSVLRRWGQAFTFTGHGLGSFGTLLYLGSSGAFTATAPDGDYILLGYVVDANTIFWAPSTPQPG